MVGMILIAGLSVLRILGRKEPGSFFRKIAWYLYKKLKVFHEWNPDGNLEKDLEIQKGNLKENREQYYLDKMVLVLKMITAGSFLMLLLFFLNYGSMSRSVIEKLVRPGYGEGNSEVEIRYQIAGEKETEEMYVPLPERKYTSEEIQTIFSEEISQLSHTILGENSSYDAITSNLVLPASLKNGLISVEWMSTPYGYLEEDGTLSDTITEDGVLVKLEATLSYEDESASFSSYAKLFPRETSVQESLQRMLDAEIERRNEEEKSQTTLTLPDKIGNQKITWFGTAPANLQALLFGMMLVLSVVIWVGKDQELHSLAERRKEQLQRDYPDLLFKLNMLLGAGLTLQNACYRIAQEYQAHQGKEKRFAYEEMAEICKDMKNGLPESSAYEIFGLRCQESSYIKLGNLLSQNLRKGSRGLLQILESEAVTAMEERKSAAVKAGEQAGTKLLFPMLILLVIVIVILMVPAVMSF